jgi:hypothetical protein
MEISFGFIILQRKKFTFNNGFIYLIYKTDLTHKGFLSVSIGSEDIFYCLALLKNFQGLLL